ncbi:hypothetical protein [Polluticoccus soli]|uniref:hypothetical protein n=1 Tax=Polluticoccus soli TaxID=3034150 RepID=UPI0023E1EEE2|nr:hypothetical protein [Flavipsychrobacter sp. JY13-12]
MKCWRSLLAYVVCGMVMLFATFIFLPRWHRSDGESALGWDVSGYYWYLPSAIIYKDLKEQKFGDSLIAKYPVTPAFEQSYKHESGNRVMGYSSGMAFMYLPVFLVAHVLAEPLGYPADGFSIPYQFAIQVGSLLAALIALWYFRKLFLMFFEDKVVAILLLLLVVGTNYLNYSAIDGAMTHNWLFLLYVFLLLNTVHFYRTLQLKYAVRIGLLCGMMTLIRPSEMISIVIPLLWGMESVSKAALKKQRDFLTANWKKLLVAATFMIAIGSIQVSYWLYVTGKPFVYSYQDKGFSWLQPNLVDYIFSYRSGWITYTPLMILSFIGIPFFIKDGKNKVAILLFFALNLYIISAWDIWWYGGNSGRAIIQSYPVIMFPMAAFIKYVFSRRILAFLLSPVIVLLAYVNIWWTYNAHAGEGLFDPNGMNNSYYWHVIGRFHVDPETHKLKDTNELFTGTPRQMKLVFSYDFESDTVSGDPALSALNGTRSGYVLQGKEYLNVPAFALDNKAGEWLRVQGTFKSITHEWDAWRMPQLTVQFTNRENIVKTKQLRPSRYLGDGAAKELFINVKIPEESFDSVKVFLWNPRSDKTLAMDDVKVWSFNE